MDLDALLGLLFFVVFIVVPMITGARKRGQGAKGQQRGQQQPGQQQRGQQLQGQQAGQQGRSGQGQGQGQLLGRPNTQGPGSGSPGSPTAGGAQQGAPNRQADHPASSTLEEIRRRVQEAQERERQREELERGSGPADGRRTSGRQRRASRGLVTSDPFERGLVSGSGKKITGEPLGREGAGNDWPPPGGELLAGRPVTSVIGREGAQGQARASGQPSVLGREGLPPGSLAGGRSGSIGREGQAGQPQLQRRRSGRSGSGLGREGSRGLGAMPTSKRSSLGREGRSPRGASLEAGEIGVGDAQPALSPYGARLGRSSLVNVDRDGIVAGLIWHEILKEAPGKKRLRRTRSRPQ